MNFKIKIFFVGFALLAVAGVSYALTPITTTDDALREWAKQIGACKDVDVVEAYNYVQKTSPSAKVKPKSITGTAADGGIDPELACRAMKFMKARPHCGVIGPRSALRTPADVNSLKKEGKKANKYTVSCHSVGLAIDVKCNSKADRAAARKFGLDFPYGNPHIQCISTSNYNIKKGWGGMNCRDHTKTPSCTGDESAIKPVSDPGYVLDNDHPTNEHIGGNAQGNTNFNETGSVGDPGNSNSGGGGENPVKGSPYDGQTPNAGSPTGEGDFGPGGATDPNADAAAHEELFGLSGQGASGDDFLDGEDGEDGLLYDGSEDGYDEYSEGEEYFVDDNGAAITLPQSVPAVPPGPNSHVVQNVLRGSAARTIDLDSSTDGYKRSLYRFLLARFDKRNGARKIYGLNTHFSQCLVALSIAAEASGHRMRIEDGYRTNDEQAVRRMQAELTYGNIEADKWVERPEFSTHVHGIAVDLNFLTPQSQEWLYEHANEFGLHFPYAHKPEHLVAYTELCASNTPSPYGALVDKRYKPNSISLPNIEDAQLDRVQQITMFEAQAAEKLATAEEQDAEASGGVQYATTTLEYTPWYIKYGTRESEEANAIGEKLDNFFYGDLPPAEEPPTLWQIILRMFGLGN